MCDGYDEVLLTVRCGILGADQVSYSRGRRGTLSQTKLVPSNLREGDCPPYPEHHVYVSNFSTGTAACGTAISMLFLSPVCGSSCFTATRL
jgi:hypothetical protein